jgi:hypothetical protein
VNRRSMCLGRALRRIKHEVDMRLVDVAELHVSLVALVRDSLFARSSYAFELMRRFRDRLVPSAGPSPRWSHPVIPINLN